MNLPQLMNLMTAAWAGNKELMTQNIKLQIEEYKKQGEHQQARLLDLKLKTLNGELEPVYVVEH